MPFFSKVFRGKDAASKKKGTENGFGHLAPPKPKWDDAWSRKDVEPEEIQELCRGCTLEIKSRGLDMPFLLLPFRPASDPSAARTFVRHYFGDGIERTPYQGERLLQELRLIEPPVLCSVLKWCWSRLSGGVVTWEAYELFKLGEQDSNIARDAFATFIPISVANDFRTKIIFDFFDLMAALAAHGKSNGLGGRKLSRYAGWWAFEHLDTGSGFDGGYKSWQSAADATSHLFFAYLRSLSPDSVQGKNGISTLPLSLQTLLEATEYPPQAQNSQHMRVSRVVMIVETVSPTPFALLRRAKHFQYRDDDKVLQRFSDYEDPAQALSDECRRVLKSISSANDSSTSKASTSLRDASWSRFEDLGFGGFSDNVEEDDILDGSALGKKRPQPNKGMRNAPQSKTDLGRPTTPSWADFLSSGFVDDNGGGSTLLLPPDKILPPINIRANSSQSHRRQLDGDTRLEPGELASINAFALDDTFWWVWITSLAGEETLARKAAFGRCALIETRINASTWLVMEEIIKGAAPEPEAGAYIAEKKSIFSFSRRGRLTRSKSNAKGALPKADPVGRSNMVSPMSKTSIAPDQHARIQAAAAALQQKHQQEEQNTSPRRARKDEDSAAKTSSVFTLQPVIMSEAAPAMKWANSYDKNAIRAKYLGDDFAGKGAAVRAASSTSINKIPSTEQGPPPPAKTSHPAARDESTAYSRSNPDLVAAINRGPDGQGPQPKPDRPVFADKPPAVPSKEATSGQAQGPTSPIERKPIAPAKENIPPPTDPNAFSSGPEYSEKPTSNGDAVPAGPPSPESAKHAHNKLKKKNQSGVKGLFGRRKEEKELPKPAPQTNTSVAATRAALEAKAAEPVPTSKASKRFSSLGRKKAPEPEAPVEKLRPAPVPEVHEHEEHPISPVVEHSRYDPSHESVSPIESSELSKAEREFRSFDQGPLEDVPAFVPDDSPSQSPIEEKTRHEPVHHESEAPARESPDDVSAVSAEYDDEPQISPNDRWAQIRKNAAERAAQRQSEEQSRQTDRTEDGETSGEETIESRVARIKARVAELTGNMDTSNSNPNLRR